MLALRACALTTLCLTLVALSAACGDDDSAPSDAGLPKDAAVTDASLTRIPRRDAAVSTTDPIAPCDRGDPSGCGPGKVCSVLVRQSPKAMQLTVSTGCLEERHPRAIGDPCDPDYTNSAPYAAPGLTDLVYVDPCGPGLICSPDRLVRGAASCQPACSSGQLGDTPFGCQSTTALCLSTGSFVEFCREAERCDVATQTGCRSGEACYLRPSTDAKSLLAVCRPQPQKPASDGDGCTGYYACNPGSVCLGPVHLPPSRWQSADVRCRHICSTDAKDQDSGTDSDAGVGGSCRSGASCVAFSGSGLSLSNIPRPPYGQCEM
jgi:hypothetical protein